MISIKEFIENEKKLHEESISKRDISFKEFEAKLKEDEESISKTDLADFAKSLKEFTDREEAQAKRLSEKLLTLKIS